MTAGLWTAALIVVTAIAVSAARSAARSHAVRRRFGSVPLTAAQLPPAPPKVASWLESAGIDASPEVVWWAWAGGVTAVALVAVLAGGVSVAILAVGGVTVATLLLLRTRLGHGDLRLEAGLPNALEAVARSLRSGASLRLAIAEAAVATPGRLGRELGEVARQVSHGATLIDALEALARRRPVPGVRLAVAALCLAVETGGAQAQAVDGVAATLRDRLAIAGEVRALSSQSHMSALVIGLAPLAFGAFAMTTDRRTGDFLFHTPGGLTLLTVGLVLDGLGWLWMQRLARPPR